MVHDPNTVHTLYKKLLSLDPRRFREQLGESMEQTFNDLYNERQTKRGGSGFVLWMFAETGVGIIKENILYGYTMKNIITNSKLTATISLILCLPLGVPFVVFMSDIAFLTRPLNNLLTINGQGGDINMLGRIVIFVGLLLLPPAFVLNLQPMLIRGGPEQKRTFHTVNLIVGAVILLLIAFTWGGLLLEEIYCLRGIRCD